MTDSPPHAPSEAPSFPCAGCGAPLEYRPGADSLACPFCGAVNEMRAPTPWEKAEATRELDYEAALAHASPAATETVRVVPCPSCGAETRFEGTEVARTCPWCATPLTAPPVTHEAMRPRGVLPFLLEEKQAREAMTRWLGRLWFAPNGLQEFARTGRAMDGLYAPCFTFDARTRTRYQGMRGDAYYVTIGSGKDRRQERRIRWSPASGRVARDFDDILRPATRAVEAAHFDRLGGWDLDALAPWDARYLAGFRAETHTVPLEAAYTEARGIMDRIIDGDIRRDIGGDEQRIVQRSTAVEDVTFKHVLLPVWLAVYRWKGEPYRVMVNGRTGAVAGERPWSAWKIALAVLAGLALIGGLIVWQKAQGG